MPTRALSGARMVRDLGVSNEFLAANVASANKIQQVASDRFISRGLANTNTGNVQGEQPWYDVPVPDWTTGAHITNSSTLQRYLSSVVATNSLVPASPVSFEVFSGNFSTVTGHIGAVLAPNGKIYCMTQYSVGVIIDPANNTTTTFGNFATPNIPNYGGVLAPNGKIYTIPYTNSFFYVIDPSNNTVTCFTTIAMGNGAYHGGVLGSDGLIYCMPSGASLLRRIDPSSNTVSVIATTLGGQIGGTIAPNGKIYGFPNSVTGMLVIDTNNPTVPSYVNVPTLGYHAGVITPEGKIYLNPFTTTIGTIVDTTSNTVTTYTPSSPSFPNLPSTGSYVTGALAANGKIYLTPWTATIGCIIDPSTNTITTWGSNAIFSGASAFHGTVVAPNGKIYIIPSTSTSCVVVNPIINNNFNINVLTAPFRNNSN